MKWINEECSVVCDKCGFTLDSDFEIKRSVVNRFKYCPNCGERCDGQENNRGVKICPICGKNLCRPQIIFIRFTVKVIIKKCVLGRVRESGRKENDKNRKYRSLWF